MSWMSHKFYARLRGKSHSILCQLCANHVVDGRGQDWSEALVKNMENMDKSIQSITIRHHQLGGSDTLWGVEVAKKHISQLMDF